MDPNKQLLPPVEECVEESEETPLDSDKRPLTMEIDEASGSSNRIGEVTHYLGEKRKTDDELAMTGSLVSESDRLGLCFLMENESNTQPKKKMKVDASREDEGENDVQRDMNAINAFVQEDVDMVQENEPNPLIHMDNVEEMENLQEVLEEGNGIASELKRKFEKNSR